MGKLIAAKPADLQVPRLSVLNYKLWSELITEALEGRGVWDYAQGTVEEPSDEDQKRIWRQNNAVAVGIIKGTLSESQLGHVMGMRNAKEVWDTLKKIHQRDDHTRVQSLLAEFIRFRLDTTIDEGASKLSRIQSEIGMLDSVSKPSDAIKTETLLAGLGPKYEATLVGLDASSTADFEETVSKLRKAEARMKTDHVPYVDPHYGRRTLAGVTNGSDQLQTKKAKCFHCGETGHFIKECEKLWDEIRQKILEEQEQKDGEHQEGNQQTARAVRRPAGSQEGFNAWGVSHQQKPEYAW
jgi:hypothetical protein